jgi:type I restriction enzyme S subunit
MKNKIQDEGKNVLPKDWEWKELSELCERITKVKVSEQKPNLEFIYLDIGSIENTNNKIVSHKTYKWKEAPSRAQQIIFKDDILFSTVRTYLKNIAIVDSGLYDRQIASSGFTVLRGKKQILHPKFLFYRTISNAFLNPLNELQTGSSYPAVRDKDVLSQEIPLPPYKVQESIVSKIEELFSELDKSIEQLKIAQQQLKVYRQSVLKWAFEGKLTNKNVKDGELPRKWKSVGIVDIVENDKRALKAGPFGSSLKKEFYVKKGYKIYGQEQVISDDPFLGDYFIDEDKYIELESCKIKPFDILISLVGTVGKVLILPSNSQQGIINPRLIKISLNKNIYLHKFFKYYFESSLVKNIYSSKAQGTTMDVLNLGIIKTIPFPLPSIDEQQLIIEQLDSKLIESNKMEKSINQNFQLIESLKHSILIKAFEGKLVN